MNVVEEELLNIYRVRKKPAPAAPRHRFLMIGGAAADRLSARRRCHVGVFNYFLDFSCFAGFHYKCKIEVENNNPCQCQDRRI